MNMQLVNVFLLTYLYNKRLRGKFKISCADMSLLVGCIIFFKGEQFTRRRLYVQYVGGEKVTYVRNCFVSLVNAGYVDLIRSQVKFGNNKSVAGYYKVSDKGNAIVIELNKRLSIESNKLDAIKAGFTTAHKKKLVAEDTLLDY